MLTPRIISGLCLSTAILGSTLPAQGTPIYRRVAKDHVNNLESTLWDPVLGDFDGDGDLEAMDRFGRLTDNHSGRFVPFPYSFPTVQCPLRAVDFDGDGRDDILDISWRSSPMAEIGVSLNRFPFTFRRTQLSFLPAGRLKALAVGDWDGDGDQDILLSNGSYRDPMIQLVNDGSGTFTDGTTARMPPPSAGFRGIWPADIDGDGDLDLIISDDRNGRRLAVMINGGGGVFAAPDATRFTGVTATAIFAVTDIDVDGDQDLVSNRDVLHNNAGFFTPTSTPLIPVKGSTTHVRMVDMDSDGDSDAWIEFTTHDVSTWFENPGNGGTFTRTTARVPSLRRNSAHVAITDTDGDGRMDVLSVGDRIGVLLGQPGGDLIDLAPEAPVDWAYGDYDGDGFTDSLFTRGFSLLLMRQNDGVGGFEERIAITGFSATYVWNQADMDGDGDLDLLVEGPWPSHTAKVMINDGTGSFQLLTGAVPANIADVRWSHFEDLDGDGDRDLLVHYGPWNKLGNFAILQNNGSGRLSANPSWQIPALSGRNLVGTVFDADGDGDVDCVVGDDDPVLYQNDGSGQMVAVVGALPPRFVTASVRPTILAPADLDGDGDTDLLTIYTSRTLLGRRPAEYGALYQNDGSGTFTVTRTFAGPDEWWDGHLVDVDDDGDEDLVVTRKTSLGASRTVIDIYDNDGKGTLTLGTRQLVGLDGLFYGKFIDVDDDGDLDFVGGSGRAGVFTNLTRQLVSRVVPRLGGTLELELPNATQNAIAAFLLLSPASLRQPLDIPDLGRLVADPAIGVSVSLYNGFRTMPLCYRIQIPNTPALAGLEIYAQAIADVWRQPRLTNTIRERVAF